MIDHVVLTVRNLEASLAFYQRALKALGHDRRVTYEGHHGHAKLTGLGDDRETYILLREGAPHPRAVHLAFVAPTQKAVRAFYDAALEAGGRDNGPPGDRVHYFSGYYAAYVLDPDGYNIEAVHQDR